MNSSGVTYTEDILGGFEDKVYLLTERACAMIDSIIDMQTHDHLWLKFNSTLGRGIEVVEYRSIKDLWKKIVIE